jgi:hypothetical protein
MLPIGLLSDTWLSCAFWCAGVTIATTFTQGKKTEDDFERAAGKRAAEQKNQGLGERILGKARETTRVLRGKRRENAEEN